MCLTKTQALPPNPRWGELIYKDIDICYQQSYGVFGLSLSVVVFIGLLVSLLKKLLIRKVRFKQHQPSWLS
nr:MAG TPA: hypothetical protein [Caudoviricetes sp.]